MSLPAAGGFVVFLLSLTVVQGQNGWSVTYTSTEICALKGSTVEMSCTYTYPTWMNGQNTTVKKQFWFTGLNNEPVDLKTESDYAGRVRHSRVSNVCTLRISDLRESDSAEYKFRFTTNQPGGSFTGSPGVTLSVTDLQVHVTASSPCAFSKTCVDAELRCQSSCRLPDRFSYVWIKNGREVLRETSSSYSVFIHSEDIISCAVKGYGMFPSPPMYAPRRPSVSVSPSGQIAEGTSVTLTCSGDANPAAHYTWYKKKGNTDLQPVSEKNQLVFESIQSSDSGEYYCTAENDLGQRTSEYILIDVKYPPRLPSVSVSPSGQIAEGSSVTLTCSGDANPAAHYTWYKEDEDSPKASGQNFTITDLRPEHSGNYYCEAQNSRGRRNSTLYLVVVADEATFIVTMFRLTLIVLLLITLISLSLCLRKKKTQRVNTEPPALETMELETFPIYENIF